MSYITWMDLTLYGLYQQVTRFTQISDLSYTTAYILIGQERFYLQHIMNCFTLFFLSNKFLKEVQSNFFNYSEPQVCPWWPLLFLSLNCVLVKVNFPPSRSVSTLKIDIFLLLFIWSFIKQVVISLPLKQMRRMLQEALRHGIIELVLRTVMYLIRYFQGV